MPNLICSYVIGYNYLWNTKYDWAMTQALSRWPLAVEP